MVQKTFAEFIFYIIIINKRRLYGGNFREYGLFRRTGKNKY
jgi:hypothetical protein